MPNKSVWKRRQLQCERLESRLPLSADAIPISAEAAGEESPPLVSPACHDVWKSTFGSTTDLRADANRNGVVDAADYSVWRDGRGDSLSTSLNDPPPQVIDVIVSGRHSTHPPYSMATVAGSGEQLRTVPVGGADTITIVFSEDVNITADTLRLVGLRTTIRPVLVQYSYNLGGRAIWNFDEFPAESQPHNGFFFGEVFSLTLSDAITDVSGNRLDGDWMNPGSVTTVNSQISHFPSGDGEPGGAFQFLFTILPGDANRDMRFDALDLRIAISNQRADLAWAQFAQGDFDGNGIVTRSDLEWVAPNWGVNVGDVRAVADLNRDWIVDVFDALVLTSNQYNPELMPPTLEDGDLNRDGKIDVKDLDLLFAQDGVRLNNVVF